ncbi:MAG TPA: MFS transporter [Terriglobales bacterium]|nr:MFS transporter [Terriglobales bacterium]
MPSLQNTAAEAAAPVSAPVSVEIRPRRLPAMFRSLHHRDFALFWTGNFLSNIGTWMQNLALGWQILLLTNSPFLLGLNGFLGSVPALVFSLPGGAIADRLSRRKLMLTTQSAMAALALILGLLTSFHIVKIHIILLISFLTGLAGALNSPAYQALVPDLVPRDDLVNAIGLNSAQFNMSRAIGPTLAGVALGSLGVAACYYLNSLSFFALIVALLVLHLAPRRVEPGPGMWGAVLDGLRFINRHRLILILLSVPAFLSLFGLPFTVLMPVFARDLLHVGASGLGYLMAGAGIGAVISALTLAAQHTAARRGGLIMSSAAVFSLALILLGRAHTFWWSFLLLVLLGATMVGALALTNTTLQMVSPPELRGRIMSFYVFAAMGLAPLGSLWVGSVAEHLGTRFALSLGGGICFTYFSIVLACLPRLRRVAKLPWPDLATAGATDDED